MLSYPVVPPLWGVSSTINGLGTLPSAYGGVTTGGFPVWTHPGVDGTAVQSSN